MKTTPQHPPHDLQAVDRRNQSAIHIKQIEKLTEQASKLTEAVEAMNGKIYETTENSRPVIWIQENGWEIFFSISGGDDVGKSHNLIKLMKQGMNEEGWDKPNMEIAIAQTEKLLAEMKRDYKKWCGVAYDANATAQKLSIKTQQA